VSIQNGGGCRSDIAAGDFTLEDAITLLPFSVTLVTLELTGTQIKMVLEEALENAFNGGSTGAYPYAAGLRYAVDANEKMGNRISSLEINIRLAEVSWDAISADMLYTVVTNDFIAGGRDGYLTFGNVGDELVVNTYTEYSQAFMDYAIQEGTLVNPPVDEFSTQSFVPLAIADETTDETVDEPTDETVDKPTDPKTDETPSGAGKLLISVFGVVPALVAALTF
jgi:5'-nucleotidase/UDP-sugar diphosphatase